MSVKLLHCFLYLKDEESVIIPPLTNCNMGPAACYGIDLGSKQYVILVAGGIKMSKQLENRAQLT
jgi:hypothetical protein